MADTADQPRPRISDWLSARPSWMDRFVRAPVEVAPVAPAVVEAVQTKSLALAVPDTVAPDEPKPKQKPKMKQQPRGIMPDIAFGVVRDYTPFGYLRGLVGGGSAVGAVVTSGFVTIQSPDLANRPWIQSTALAIQPTDGKILLGSVISDTGVPTTGIDSWLMHRLNTNGNIDSSFGTSGYVLDPAPVGYDNPWSGFSQIIALSSGRILAAIRARSSQVGSWTSLNGSITSGQTAITVQALNVVGGTLVLPALPSYWCINDNVGGAGGSPEIIKVTSYGSGTNWTAQRAPYGPAATSHASGLYVTPVNTYLVNAFTSAGVADSTFATANPTGFTGQAGFPTIPGPGNHYDSTNNGVAADLAVDANGKILTCGWTIPGLTVSTEDCYAAVIRWNADGSIDSTVGAGGFNFGSGVTGGGTAFRLSGGVGTGCDTMNCIIPLASGKYLLGGTSCYGPVPTPNQFVPGLLTVPPDKNTGWSLMRLNSDLTLDTLFGTSGADLIANSGDLNFEWIGAYSPGQGGFVPSDLSGMGYMGGKGIAEDQNHKIYCTGIYLVGAYGATTAGTWTVKRRLANGGADTGWNSTGTVTTAIGGQGYDYAYIVAVDSNNKPLVAGTAQISASPTVTAAAIVRYNTDGTLDNTFGTGGIVTFAPNLGLPGQRSAVATGLQIQSDGKILLSCSINYKTAGGTKYASCVARFTTAGALDTNFGQAMPVRPSAPTSLAAVGGNTSIALTWTDPGGPVASYSVYRSTTPGGEGSTPYATGLTSASYTDSSVSQDVTYYYQVTAVNTGGESAKSNEASAHAHIVYLLHDLFAGTNGTNLTAHTMDVGSGWTQLSGGYTLNGSGAAVPTGSGVCLDVADAGQADMDVSVTVNASVVGMIAGMALRAVDASNYIECIFDIQSGNNAGFSLYTVISGTPAQIATFAITPSASTNYTLRCVVKGNTWTGYLNGVQKWQTTSSQFNTATKAGLRNNLATTLTYSGFQVLAP